ncbi:MAG: redoxin domain-containing protein [Candidatus Dadabacteria bacterium]|nr:redoxin domain-containing protein [Candidatus Dadabacteria bacterium]NIV42699.1 redoxin domain-containing protein [Candidatus Dadabacteria bacterium]NIX15442.1 redoxin domain-containing protein [Candidatus Dadabacteria bacterium]NIY22104.1 redoxin domain-containing protein [Candidatus Dadabacteria bacterium]
MDAQALSIGDKAPTFSLPDESGAVVNLSDYKENVVVLEWINPDCPYVKRHYSEGTMKKLSEKYGEKIVWIAVNSTHYMDNNNNSDWKSKYLLEYSILNDSSGNVGRSFGAKTTPHMFIIKDGVIIYAGAIDDDKWGKSDKRVNYVDLGLGEVLNGQAVTTSETKPYGCSVKYK